MRLPLLAGAIAAVLCSCSFADEPESGFKPIFDGQSLAGWRGKEGFWKVQDGAIVGETTADHPLDKNTFLVWDYGEVDDFELRLKFRISGSDKANSGIQFRGTQREDRHVIGYQADIDRAGQWIGALYDEEGRKILAKRGQKTVISEAGEIQPAQVADPAELLQKVHIDDWNDYSITARGNQITLKINGVVTAEVIDHDKQDMDRSGLLALQLHVGPPMKVEFKDLRLKRFPLEDGWKKVVFVAGSPSHGYFSHEHNAGCLLLEKSLNAARKEQGLKVISTVYRNGWPKDPTALDNADTVVSYCDGGGRHYLNEHLDEFDRLVQERGVGLVCLHYGVETVTGPPGDHFLKWIGGFFEPFWSVNPTWAANYQKLPEHPITRGVHPFEINDEWYYHMRFVPDMKGVTPILTDLPPRETLSRPDGHHSGNPAVRAAVLERQEPQHMAWAYDRPDGKGRGFGFTGGHFHANWQQDDFRKLVLNAIVWTAGMEVPAEGVSSPTPSAEDMEANQDEPRPEKFKFESPVKRKPVASATPVTPGNTADAPLYSSPVVTSRTPGQAVEIDVALQGARQLCLVVSDGGNGIACDWVDWIDPRLTDGQSELKLTDLAWKSATSGWGEVRKGKNAQGDPIMVNGRTYENGIGTHASSIIVFDLPADKHFTRFKAQAGLDKGGVSQGDGGTTSAQFHVFSAPPSRRWLAQAGFEPGLRGSHESTDALEQLDVHPELTATLFASEPMMTNPTSIDIDHLGRVWVCEGVNYRAFRNADVIGENHPADRILILEDTDGNSQADKSSVFYQGHDVDAAQGILVLPAADGKGTRALISAGDQIFFLIDDDGDLKADRQEVLFTGIGGAQHDHGIHACHFGPDGKLYFNFGNSGTSIKDKHGKPIIDRSGRAVNNSRHPYQEGMVFRCNLDGSQFETLAWNFRNNWELCVDSFGTIWQSDNDDDGNRGVRINYVMEYGNYGFKDELTGASWQTPRTNWESEIPLRHWHLNDPGVIPNLLQTGAGAPTGICIYEGSLLPEALRGAVIHCDAGANVCRAYITRPAGAGYTAEIVNLLVGTRNNWFRPSDVCVAPDGSLLVADWYDPGVGGHRMQDIAHGRLFRLAPLSAGKYAASPVDVSTPQGAVAALQSPNMATRYLAYTALQRLGPQALPALEELWNSSDPRMQARALWAACKLGLPHDKKAEVLRTGLMAANPDLKVAANRLLRQLLSEISFEDLQGCIDIHDPSAAVRRELLITLRELNPSWIPQDIRDEFYGHAFTQFALQYDGQDRWYLEALGLAGDGHWDECLPVWMEAVGEDWKTTKAGRDIVWRSRGTETPRLLELIISNPNTPTEELPRYFRALDFQVDPSKQSILAQLAFAALDGDEQRVTLIRSEALNRMENLNVSRDPQHRQAVEQVLERSRGTERYVRLVGRFNLADHYPDLLSLAQAEPQSQLAVEAIKTLLDKQQGALLQRALTDEDRERVERTLEALATAADKRSVPLVRSLVKDEKRPLWARQAAVKSLGASYPGAQAVLEMAQKGDYPQELKQSIAATLNTVSWGPILEAAAKLFPPPPGKDSAPLPPIQELAARNGDAGRGKIVFNTTGTCNKCHQVNGIGTEIGPNLSEIGKKLSKVALHESILYPSAGISHGFENWLILTLDGQLYTGLIVSENETELKIKDEKGIVRTIPVVTIEERKKQDVSLMPAELQKLLSAEELVDVVEYLTTLKERKQ